jgi:hypothetical protein
MSRWISNVRPPGRPAMLSRWLRSGVLRGSIAYSAVIQPVPLPSRNRGTLSVSVARQSTIVSPNAMRAEPSANFDTPTSIAVGQKAPASKTPTVADVGGDLTKVSTDAKPDPAFYQTSVAAALAAHKPFILIFATPKFCKSAQCGPTLDHFKPIAAAHPDVTFINVEPYKLEFKDGALQAVLDSQGQLIADDFSNEWGLRSEPWMFAVDRNGVVQGSYVITITDAELAAILPVITAGG